MNIIVDASVILAVITNEKDKDKILGKTRHANLLAPAIIDMEILKTIMSMYKRQWLRLNQVKEAFLVFQEIPIRRLNLPPSDIALLAINLNISANDAAYLLAAAKHKCPIITLDERLKIAAHKSGQKLLEVNN